MYTFKCKQCGKEVTLPYYKKRSCCSYECAHASYKKPLPSPRLCACGCGAIIIRKNYKKTQPQSFVKNHHLRGKRNPNWNNGRIETSHGHIFIYKPEHPNANKAGYVGEHRFVMSEHIGRPIASNENVHHINGIPNDNRLKNLILMTRSEHTSYHHKGLMKPNSLKNLIHGNNRFIIKARSLSHPR